MRVPGHQRKSYAWRWTAALAGLAVLAFALVMALAVTPASRVEAVTFTVDNLTDTAGQACTTAANDCSLRSAIQLADANAVIDTISFGSLSGTITLGSDLPALTAAEATTIDGNGSITVNGGGTANCFTINSANNIIRDLAITNCGVAVLITTEAADGNALRGNTIYGNTPGAAGAVEISAGGDDNTVGGTTAADRNIIRDNTGNGVYVTGAASTGNVIEGNCIGTQSTCSIAAPNTLDGVAIVGAVSTTVGGTAAGAGNTIAFNGSDGVSIAAGTNNIVTRNVMFLNTGLGINAVAPPATLLAGCADAGGGSVACSGTGSAAGVIVEVYHANGDAGTPEGDLFFCTNVAGGGGAWGCTFANPGGGSATATERTPGGNTSDFSPAVGIPAGPVITPTFTPTITPIATATLTPTPGASHFYGSVTLNGLAVAAGTAVTATINGYVCGQTTVDASSNYAIDVASSSVTYGCGYAGATVNFTVAGYPANSGTWYTNTSTNLNLAASTTAATVTPIPTATAIGGATATPTTGAMVSVPLVAGCNPVASTYPNATGVATIAGAISPSTILISIWKFQTATSTWLGYSPQAPQASNLTAVDRLDAIFICVSSAGTWSRPVI